MDEYAEAPISQSLEPCGICGRTFSSEILTRHLKICEKNAAKKRKLFDSSKQRRMGTDLASVPKSKETKQPPSKIKKNNWRAKHEDFIANIKNARAVTVAIKTGAPLPPPPAQKRTVNPDYVKCPHCSRNFNAGAAERHVPWCQEQTKRINIKPKAKSTDKDKVAVRTQYKPPLPGRKKQILPPTRSPAGSYRKTNSATELDRQLDSLHIQDRPGRAVDGARGTRGRVATRGAKTSSAIHERRGSGGKNTMSHRNFRGDGARTERPTYDDSEEDNGYSPHGKPVNSSGHLSANHRSNSNSYRTPTPPSSIPTQTMRRPSMEKINGKKASKFCHECGTKYPVANAKYCCECGAKRVVAG